jgi:formate hydrogenlyase transcriptional activator
MGRRIESIPTRAMEALARYPWPGNIRELENVIERAVILSPGNELQINLSELKAPDLELPAAAVRAAYEPSPSGGRENTVAADAVTLDDAERQHILRALQGARWVLGGPNGAAARLAMKRTTLQSKMKKLGISRPR